VPLLSSFLSSSLFIPRPSYGFSVVLWFLLSCVCQPTPVSGQANPGQPERGNSAAEIQDPTVTVPAQADKVDQTQSAEADKQKVEREPSEPRLTIGSKAPSIDIEHWISDGEGRYKKITSFESSKVYVLEFWATWCGPCVEAMPHVSELQQKFADQGVQIIGISDEDFETVEEFLKREQKQTNTTFAQITKSYSLTADPDRSVHDEYLGGLGIQFIPMAVIVGKDGLIEWVGSPIELEEPLQQVVDGKWDREAFKGELANAQLAEEAFQDLEENLSRISERFESGDVEAGFELLDKTIAETSSPEIKELYQSVRRQFTVIFLKGQEAVDALQSLIDECKEDIDELGNLLSLMCTVHEDHPLDSGVIQRIKETTERTIKQEEDSFILHYVLGQIHLIDGQLDEAITKTEKALKLLDQREGDDDDESLAEYSDEISTFLNNLKAKKAAAKSTSDK
jgi:thiol-disulfide isomerase/thioredoxin